MTISTTTSTITVQGNGSTTQFNFPFVADQASDLIVIYTDANNNQTTLNPSTYTVTLNPIPPGGLWSIGGYVTYNPGTPISSGTFMTITRAVPYEQLITISNQGAFYPQVVETMGDTSTLQIQQIYTQVQQLQTEVTTLQQEIITGVPVGSGITWLGLWSNAVTYMPGNAVDINGSSYICIALNSNQQPPNATYWNYLALAGSNGTNGNTVLNGTINPTSGVGNNGDFYINTVTETIFGPKTSGAWPTGSSLIGPAGPTGPAGPSGASTFLIGSGIPIVSQPAGTFYSQSDTIQLWDSQSTGAAGVVQGTTTFCMTNNGGVPVLTSTPTVGNVTIAWVTNAASAPTTFTANTSAGWNLITSGGSGNDDCIGCFYRYVQVGDTTTLPAVTTNTLTNPVVLCTEITNISAVWSNVLEQSDARYTQTTSTLTTNSITTTNTNDLILTGVFNYIPIGSGNIGVTSPYGIITKGNLQASSSGFGAGLISGLPAAITGSYSTSYSIPFSASGDVCGYITVVLKNGGGTSTGWTSYSSGSGGSGNQLGWAICNGRSTSGACTILASSSRVTSVNRSVTSGQYSITLTGTVNNGFTIPMPNAINSIYGEGSYGSGSNPTLNFFFSNRGGGGSLDPATFYIEVRGN